MARGTIKIGTLAELDVLSYNINFSRGVDHKGRPGGNVQGGELHLTLDVGEKPGLAELMLNAGHKTVPGTLEIKTTEEGKTFKTIKFESGFITSYSESFSSFGGDNIQVAITINAFIMQVDDATQKNDWPETAFTAAAGAPAVAARPAPAKI